MVCQPEGRGLRPTPHTPPPIPDPGARSPTAAPSLSCWASESTAGSQSLALTIWRERLTIWRERHGSGVTSPALCLFGGIDESLLCPRLCHPEERPFRGSPHRSSCQGSCELVALEHFKNFIGIILPATEDPFDNTC